METNAIDRIYDRLPTADFSKQVRSVSTERLAVESLGDNGWGDLGDPRRALTALFGSVRRCAVYIVVLALWRPGRRSSQRL